MPGGAAAVREPWRNLYAHLMAAGRDLRQPDCIADKPRALLDAMIRNGVNSPLASSCGRLFDAVAAALGICRDRQGHEGEAASRLEALVASETLRDEDDALAYPFADQRFERIDVPCGRGRAGCRIAYSEAGWSSHRSTPMWHALLGDLSRGTPPAVIAARFHKGLAIAVVAMTRALRTERARFDTVALSGGCFQNAVLFEQTAAPLRDAGFTVLTPHAWCRPMTAGSHWGRLPSPPPG